MSVRYARQHKQHLLSPRYVVDTASSGKVITVEECRRRLRMEHDDDDELLYDLIGVAETVVQKELSRQLLTATYSLYLDAFPEVIYLEKHPAKTVTSITYYDTTGTQQTLATSRYNTDFSFLPARVLVAPNQTWPSTQDRPDAVRVIFTAGEADADDVDQEIKECLRMFVAHLISHPESTVVGRNVATVPRTLQHYMDSLQWKGPS